MTAPNTHQLLHPSHWKRAVGYANGMLAEGKTVFVGGQIGWNADQVFETSDFVGQIEQALRNIVPYCTKPTQNPNTWSASPGMSPTKPST